MKRVGPNNRWRTAAQRAAAITACLLCSLPAVAGTSSCQRELGSADITLIKSALHVRGAEHAANDRQCAAYREHVTTVSRVREVFERCLAADKRDGDLQQLAGVIDNANGVIARVCVQ